MAEIRQLQYFVALSEEGTFVRAAERHHITQSALSQQIARLEREWGVQLFDRGARGADLTPQGAELLAHTRSILRELVALQARANSLARQSSSELRVGSPTYAARSSSRQRTVARFRDRQPQINLRFTNAWSPHLIQLLIAGGLDLTYAMLAPREDEVEYLLVEDEPAVLWMPQDHPLAGAEYATLDDLAGERVSLYPRSINSWVFESMTEVLRDRGVRIGELTETSLPGIIEQVRAGVGLVPVVPWESDFVNPAELEGLASVPMAEESGLRYRLWLARRRHGHTGQIESFWACAKEDRNG